MKREARNHSKTKRLCRKLDIPAYQAIGILESLWLTTAANAWRGDIGKLSNEEIAIELDYRGDEDRLIDALVQCGWLDRSEEYRLLVHDWPEHADNAVKKRAERAILSGQSGFYQDKSRHVQTNELIVIPHAHAGPEPEPEPVPEPEPLRRLAETVGRRVVDFNKADDSVDARILCESVGIFGMREEADMMRCLAVYVKSSGNGVEAAIHHMVARWEQYQSRAPSLGWQYGSSYKFFMSGKWNEPETWGGEGANRAEKQSQSNLSAAERYLERVRNQVDYQAGGSEARDG